MDGVCDGLVVYGFLYESFHIQLLFVHLDDCVTAKLLHIKENSISIKCKPNRQTHWANVSRTGQLGKPNRQKSLIRFYQKLQKLGTWMLCGLFHKMTTNISYQMDIKSLLFRS